jgi:hypothetical protein
VNNSFTKTKVLLTPLLVAPIAANSKRMPLWVMVVDLAKNSQLPVVIVDVKTPYRLSQEATNQYCAAIVSRLAGLNQEVVKRLDSGNKNAPIAWSVFFVRLALSVAEGWTRGESNPFLVYAIDSSYR